MDPVLEDDYAKLTCEGSLGWQTLNEESLKNAELASVRQIAHEVTKSLEDEFSEYF